VKIKLSDYVFRFLADHGVKHVFMLPGGGAMHLNNALGANNQIDYTCMLHEQGAAVAAEGWARVTNDLGVALVTTGPGGTNAVTGVLAAWQDSTPCLFLSGQVKRPDIAGNSGMRQLGVQEVDIVSIVKSITKYAVTVMEPDQIRYHLEQALHLARSGRPGPVWLDIPLDVQAAMVDTETMSGFTATDRFAVVSQQDVETTLAWLCQAERPVILAGNGIRVAGATTEFLSLVDILGIPVLTTRLGVDLIPAAHPHCFGMPGGIASRSANFILQNSDCLLILGARLDLALIGYAPDRLARGARKIMVNIDPLEIKKLGGAIDLPIAADARSFIQKMQATAGQCGQRDISAWRQRCRQWRERYPFVTPEHFKLDGLSLYAFSQLLSDALRGGEVVLPGSAGVCAEIFLTAFQAKPGQRIFHNKGTGAMGLCQPSAIGACLASGGATTVCVDGDGGFQMNIQELEVVRRRQLPIKFFVINNGGYASIRASQSAFFGRLTGADATSGLTLPDVKKLAVAYGIAVEQISNVEEARQKLPQLLVAAGPVVCEVMTLPDEVRAPRVAAAQRKDGSMFSKPLEDMWPFLDREEFLANMIVPPLPEE
jgi:acetolactate synthase-1/2/3 large subunit